MLNESDSAAKSTIRLLSEIDKAVPKWPIE